MKLMEKLRVAKTKLVAFGGEIKEDYSQIKVQHGKAKRQIEKRRKQYERFKAGATKVTRKTQRGLEGARIGAERFLDLDFGGGLFDLGYGQPRRKPKKRKAKRTTIRVNGTTITISKGASKKKRRKKRK